MLVALTATLGSSALAHTGAGQVDSFTSGLAHPLGGIDHILAMIAVGIWAVVAGGRTIWILPTTCVATRLAGFAVARLSVPMPFVEPVILSSVVVLGLLVALAVKAPLVLGAAIAGSFKFFHGHAHGAEATSTGLIASAAGFALATAALHAMGTGFGLFAEASIGRTALRAMGGLAVLGGIALIAGMP
jgi:urease accessory protein